MNEVYKEKIRELCIKYQVIRCYLFGSYASNKQTEKSDIDFLIKFGNIDLFEYFDNYLNLKTELEKLYNCKVDLVEEETLKNPFLIQSINQNKICIFSKLEE